MRYLRIYPRGLWVSAILVCGLGVSINAAAQGPVPDNLGGGLRHLIEAPESAAAVPSAASAAELFEPHLLRDAEKRVLVNVWLDGGRPLAAVRASLASLGANL